MKTVDAVAALDLGTSGCKGSLYSSTGSAIHLAAASYVSNFPQAGFVEQDPDDYLRSARRVSARLSAFARAHKIVIRAVSFSTQTPTLIFCNEHGKSTSPAIVWQDTRAGKEAMLIERRATAEERREWFGLDLPLGAAATPPKLLWMKRHAPDAWRATRWVLQPKDYVAAALTGRMTTDPWCAKGIVNLDGSAHPAFLDLLGKRASISPPLLAPSEISGAVQPEAARSWSLEPGTPVITGWSDALAGVLATGAFHTTSRGFLISGTSEIIGLSRRGGERDAGLFLVPAWLLPCRSLDLHYGPIQGGGGTLDWAARLLGKTTRQAMALLPPRLTPTEIVFHPYLAGERAPYWNHRLTAGFSGVRASHNAQDLLIATLQGVALQERLVLERAGRLRGPIVLAGGGARDPRWNQLRADIHQRPILVLEDREASLRGAALLAWSGLGEIDLRKPPDGWFRGEVIEPDCSYRKFCDQLMARFRSGISMLDLAP